MQLIGSESLKLGKEVKNRSSKKTAYFLVDSLEYLSLNKAIIRLLKQPPAGINLHFISEKEKQLFHTILE